jgi:hypothetical protein
VAHDLDPRDAYLLATSSLSSSVKPTESKVNAQGFGNIHDEVLNEIKPWILAPEYDGSYADGLKQGSGRCVYPNGDIYKGTFQKDQRHGTGIIMFKDGLFYKGAFVNGQIKGKGIYKMMPEVNSIIIEGNFDNGIC